MTNKDAEIREALIGFFVDECSMTKDEAEAAKDLFSSRRLDSLDFLDLTTFLHEQFGIEVNTNDMGLKDFDDLESITRYVSTSTS